MTFSFYLFYFFVLYLFHDKFRSFNIVQGTQTSSGHFFLDLWIFVYLQQTPETCEIRDPWIWEILGSRISDLWIPENTLLPWRNTLNSPFLEHILLFCESNTKNYTLMIIYQTIEEIIANNILPIHLFWIDKLQNLNNDFFIKHRFLDSRLVCTVSLQTQTRLE